MANIIPPSIPRSSEAPGQIRAYKSQIERQETCQLITLVLSILCLLVGAAFYPKCICAGSTALIGISCVMGIIAIACIAINVILCSKRCQLEKALKRIQDTKTQI